MTNESFDGETPNGGVKARVFYLDDNGVPVEKSVATNCIIVEYDAQGKELMRTYGTCNA